MWLDLFLVVYKRGIFIININLDIVVIYIVTSINVVI